MIERSLRSTSGPPRPWSSVRSRDDATDVTRITVSARCGPTPAVCHSHDGTRRHTSEPGNTRIPAGAGPGGTSPYLVSRERQARRASIEVTFCSSTAARSASNTRRVRGRRRPGFLCRESASSGVAATSSSVQSSPAPSSSGRPAITHSAPAPHAVAVTPLGVCARCRVAAPWGVRWVRQMPDGSARKAGSPAPRRSGASVWARSRRCAGV